MKRTKKKNHSKKIEAEKKIILDMIHSPPKKPERYIYIDLK